MNLLRWDPERATAKIPKQLKEKIGAWAPVLSDRWTALGRSAAVQKRQPPEKSEAVSLQVVARAGFEPATFGLWADSLPHQGTDIGIAGVSPTYPPRYLHGSEDSASLARASLGMSRVTSS